MTESWLNQSISNKVISLNGYSFVRQDIATRESGVGMYIRSNLRVNVLRNKSENVLTRIEIENASTTLVDTYVGTGRFLTVDK